MTVIVTDEQANLWRAMYEGGMTFEQVGLEVGYSAQIVRKHAIRVGLVPRAPRPGERRPMIENTVDGIRGATQPIRRVVSGRSYRGHRRGSGLR